MRADIVPGAVFPDYELSEDVAAEVTHLDLFPDGTIIARLAWSVRRLLWR